MRSELDRRYPERLQLRDARTAEDLRAVWETVERRWSETLSRAERLPEGGRLQRVDDEWSVVETLRHLVFAVDVWLGRMVRLEDRPVHPPACADGRPEGAPPELGIDLAARPSYDEAVATHAERGQQVRAS